MITSSHTAYKEKSFEFFEGGNSSYQLTEGEFTIIKGLPAHFYNLLKKELSTDILAQRGLNKLDIHIESERIQKFYLCNYSASDEHPDIDANGNIGKREFVKCCNRGKCPAEGTTCRFPNNLSKKEIDVSRLIALGYSDAQICYELDIAQDTLRNHKNHIEIKIGLKGKPAIAAWTVKNEII